MAVWEFRDSRIERCDESSRWAALEVLYRRVPAPLRDRLIVEVLEESARGDLDLTGLWVASGRGGRIEGVLFTQELAGRAAAVWAPEISRKWHRSVLATALIETALADLKARGIVLAQAVMDESADPRTSRDLERGGMPRITELLYLERETALPLVMKDRVEFSWTPYCDQIEDEFRRVLRDTYDKSLDMPELEGTRGLDEILAGYRAAGCYDPGRWRLGRLANEPGAAAILLLTEIPSREAWEVMYLGLTIPARRRGLGLAILRHALDLAQGRARMIELAVDARNHPARRLYESAGFTLRDRRVVHLAVLGRPAGSSGEFSA